MLGTQSTYAVAAGFCAAFGSFFGKLSGVSFNVFGSKLDLIINIICFILMITLNGAMWAAFVKALRDSTSTLHATALSAATNYGTSIILGSVVFSEETGLLGWTGISCVLIGLTLIKSSNDSTKSDKPTE